MPRYLSILFLLTSLSVLPACDGGGALTSSGGTQNHSGELKSGDEQLDTGEYFDEYTVSGKAGDRYIITLNSSAFDTYLMFVNEDVSWQMENDDTVTEDFGLSQLTATLPEDGTYSVVVTSFEPDETGPYELTIEEIGARAE